MVSLKKKFKSFSNAKIKYNEACNGTWLHDSSISETQTDIWLQAKKIHDESVVLLDMKNIKWDYER